MASLVKPWITSYHRSDGTKVKKGTPDARKKRRRSRHWYGQHKHPGTGRWQRVNLSTDKTVAQQLLSQLLKKAENARVGIGDPFEEHRKRPLAEHLADFRRYLKAKDNTHEHAARTANRVQAILDGCRFVFMVDLSASAPVEWLAEQRRADRFGIQTANYYLRDCKTFCRGLMKDRRSGDNPMAHLSAMSASADGRLERRSLSADEFPLLVSAASSGPLIRGLSGLDRATLYIVAAYSGFRVSELASLEPESFDLDANPQP